MTETTATTVITPMITPSSVRKLRRRWRRSASAAMRSVSMSALRLFLLLLFRLLLGDAHLLPVLDLPQRAERSGDDLRPFADAAGQLDLRLAGDARRHRDELHLQLLVQRVDAFLFFLRPFLLAHHEGLDGDGQRLGAGAGNDVRGAGA